MTAAIVQPDWVLDPVPATLPTWAIVLGLEALFLNTAISVSNQHPLFRSMTARERFVVTASFALGFFFASLSVLRNAYGLYAAYLFLLFRTVEGAAAARFYRKVVFAVRNRSLPGSTTMSDRALHYMVVFSILVAGLGVAFNVLSKGPVFRSVWYDLALVYTVVSFLLAFVGAHWRVRSLSDDFNGGIAIGFALCIGGAETFNYASIAGEIGTTVAGSATHLVGFWAAVAIWGFDALTPDSASTDRDDDHCAGCGHSLAPYQNPEYCPDCGRKIG